jgi:hypothetical protein
MSKVAASNQKLDLEKASYDEGLRHIAAVKHEKRAEWWKTAEPEILKMLKDILANKTVQYGALGSGLGGLAGLLSTYAEPDERRRNPLRKMMTGSLLGAGVGAAGHLLANTAFGGEESKAQKLNRLTKELEKVEANIKADTAPQGFSPLGRAGVYGAGYALGSLRDTAYRRAMYDRAASKAEIGDHLQAMEKSVQRNQASGSSAFGRFGKKWGARASQLVTPHLNPRVVAGRQLAGISTDMRSALAEQGATLRSGAKGRATGLTAAFLADMLLNHFASRSSEPGMMSRGLSSGFNALRSQNEPDPATLQAIADIQSQIDAARAQP